ncbi:FAD dependent oxidoreductase [Blyttiomyces helicus]|uniref:FAD dependent oxidoreductase n=1 Tax=Blyttiomyces helicus TaxID=388810 RepID=A0A4P9WM62_9FUNG|nr:FAD dependent oxidoreductase [Blyttiomyces helicus]|eukprot:RKO93295.1 FAD dependent oxidoreductase [Blyttiomyces helicus]
MVTQTINQTLAKPKHALIIGGGVTGLTTAHELLLAGFKVTIVSKAYAPASLADANRITSQIAGALWEWPPAVCGRHTDGVSLGKSKRWCMVAYERFKEMSNDPILREAAGVQMRMANFFFLKPVLDCPEQTDKMHEIEAHADGFRHEAAITQELGINNDYGVKDAYQHLAPVIDTDRYMQWIYARVTELGGRLLSGVVTGDLLDQESTLLAQHNADVLINCTGLAGNELAGDKTVYPLRGALVRVINDGSRFPQIKEAMSLSLHGREGANDLIFIVPRNDNTLILGGLTEPNEFSLDITMENYPPLKEMYDRNIRFYPDLAKAEIDPVYPIAVGLRPLRKQNVRVEREQRIQATGQRSRIVHNYGHGGSGFSLSFGCAEDVVNFAMEVVSERTSEQLLQLQARL